MLHRIIGKSGSGKTAETVKRIKEQVEKSLPCIVIVPEQQSVAYERMLSKSLGDGFNMHCEVLNFERLPNRIARDYGGLTASFMDKGCRDVLLASSARAVKDSLTEYALMYDDKQFIKKIGELLSSLKMRGITPDMLESAAENLEKSRLKDKLSDISVILKEYSARMPDGMFDPNDGLTRLAESKDTYEFFKNKCVFIDSCYTYTRQETEIIKIILACAKEVYISFLMGEDPDLYTEINLCAEEIGGFAEIREDIVLGDNKRAVNKCIEYAQDFLWDASAKPYDGCSESIKIVSAADTFGEAEAVSSIIHSLIRQGYRYKDITVITDTAESYDGIIDTVLSADGIPCYMSVKDELSTKPVIAFVLSALEIAATDFSPNAVNKYIKNSFCALSVKERDLLSRYTETWNIRGKRWRDGNMWMMNPEGYTTSLTEYSAHVLAAVNRAKDKMTNLLLPAYETLVSPELTVKSGLEALYGLLIAAEADKRLLARAKVLMEAKKERESDILSGIWNTLIDVFDKLVMLCGDEKVTPEILHQYLNIMFSSRKVGAIPPVNDSVTIGNASLIRAENCRVCILMGVNDGAFPRSVGKNALFDRSETDALEKLGIEISLPFLRQQNEQRFYFTLAASAPAEKLYITYPRGDMAGNSQRPSVAVLRIKELFGTKETVFGNNETDKLYCENSALRVWGGIKNPYIKELLAPLKEKTENEQPLYNPEAYVDLGENVINLTPSRADKYASCAFSFFARYLLKLRENKKADFAAPEIGTFIHSILEEYVSARVKDGVYVPLTDEQTKSEIDSLTQSYILSVAGDYANDKRFAYAVGKFKKSLFLVIKNISDEFAQSKFCPSGFEVKIGLGDLPAVEVPTINGKVRMRGIVDRTDTYTVDGITYLRVVDYKTGEKKFSLEKTEKGIDLQMLMYLFACCDADKTGKTLPAGVLYMPASAPKLDGEKEYENITEAAAKGIKKSGLLLADPEIIRAMEAEGGGVFIPARLNKDGSISARGVSTKTLEEFDGLKDNLTKTVRDMGTRLISGDMCINPLKDLDISPCTYCEYKAFCRKK